MYRVGYWVLVHRVVRLRLVIQKLQKGVIVVNSDEMQVGHVQVLIQLGHVKMLIQICHVKTLMQVCHVKILIPVCHVKM